MLNYWLRQFDSAKKVVPLQSETHDDDMANRSKDDYKDENAQLKKRIRELEKALEFSRLETLARPLLPADKDSRTGLHHQHISEGETNVSARRTRRENAEVRDQATESKETKKKK